MGSFLTITRILLTFLLVSSIAITRAKIPAFDVNGGTSPVSIMGGAIYFTTHLLGKPRLARDISMVAGVSEGTIRLVYKLNYAERKKLADKKWIKEGKAVLDRLLIVQFEQNPYQPNLKSFMEPNRT